MVELRCRVHPQLVGLPPLNATASLIGSKAESSDTDFSLFATRPVSPCIVPGSRSSLWTSVLTFLSIESLCRMAMLESILAQNSAFLGMLTVSQLPFPMPRIISALFLYSIFAVAGPCLA